MRASSSSLAWLFPLVCLLLGAGAACAHDPLASFADLWLSPQTMELTVTMARSEAFLLIKNENPGAAYVDVDTFPKLRERLIAQAANLCQLTVNGGKLTPSSLEVSMTDENDVKFQMIFPRPAAGGPLRLDAPFLRKTVDGEMLTFALWKEDKTNLNNQEMRADETSVIAVRLPPVSAPPAAP